MSKEQLGRATWTLLHTVAAHYPEQPSRKERQDVTRLVGPANRKLIISWKQAFESVLKPLCSLIQADPASHLREVVGRVISTHDNLRLVCGLLQSSDICRIFLFSFHSFPLNSLTMASGLGIILSSFILIEDNGSADSRTCRNVPLR